MKQRKAGAESQILSGWKAIANYLGAGVRTAQRYERETGLPIYRPAGKPRSSVTAFKAELDRWAKGGKAVPAQLDHQTKALLARANRVRAEFLLVDAEVALTLSGLALNTNNAENKERQSTAARKAHDMIMRLRQNLDLNEAESEKLEAMLQRLRNELRELGKPPRLLP